MRKSLIGLIIALTLMLSLTLLVVAQEGSSLGQFQPFSINIQHEEPITVTSTTTTAAGEVVTVTTPITVGVDLRINVTGPNIVEVASDGATGSSVELVVAEPKPAPAGVDGFEDSSGRIYMVGTPDAVTVGQVQSKESFIGTEVFGQLTNETGDTLKYVQVVVQFYDEAGTLLSVDTGYASLEELEPGQSSAFQVIGQAEYPDVAGYAVQVEP